MDTDDESDPRNALTNTRISALPFVNTNQGRSSRLPSRALSCLQTRPLTSMKPTLKKVGKSTLPTVDKHSHINDPKLSDRGTERSAIDCRRQPEG